jgi:hypothetical protein
MQPTLAADPGLLRQLRCECIDETNDGWPGVLGCGGAAGCLW